MQSLLTIDDNLESSYAAPKKDENGKFPFWLNYFKV